MLMSRVLLGTKRCLSRRYGVFLEHRLLGQGGLEVAYGFRTLVVCVFVCNEICANRVDSGDSSSIPSPILLDFWKCSIASMYISMRRALVIGVLAF